MKAARFGFHLVLFLSLCTQFKIVSAAFIAFVAYFLAFAA